MDGLVNISSYWTFSDVFEEGTLLPVPFHGGFGLLTIGGTPKPAYRAFQLLHGTGAERYPVTGANSGDCLGDVGVLATTLRAPNATGGRSVRVFVWNHPPTFGKDPMGPCNVTVKFHHGSGMASHQTGAKAPAQARMARIDTEHANPMAAWTAMGSPTYPTEAQLAELEAASELTWADVAMAAGALSASVPAHGLVVYDL